MKGLAFLVRYQLLTASRAPVFDLITLVVLASLASIAAGGLALSRAVDSVFSASGRPGVILVMRQGAQSEVESFLAPSDVQAVRMLARRAGASDSAEVSAESLMVSLTRGKSSFIALRGRDPQLSPPPPFRLLSGRLARSGSDEAIVGKELARRMELAPGKDLTMAGRPWRVTGVFELGEDLRETEAWTDAVTMGARYGAPALRNSIRISGTDGTFLNRLKSELAHDRSAPYQAISERAYFDHQSADAKTTVTRVGVVLGVFVLLIGLTGVSGVQSVQMGRLRRNMQLLTQIGYPPASVVSSIALRLAVIGVVAATTALAIMRLAVDGLRVDTLAGLKNLPLQLHIGRPEFEAAALISVALALCSLVALRARDFDSR